MDKTLTSKKKSNSAFYDISNIFIIYLYQFSILAWLPAPILQKFHQNPFSITLVAVYDYAQQWKFPIVLIHNGHCFFVIFTALRDLWTWTSAAVVVTYPEGFPRLLYKGYSAPVRSIKAH